MKRYLLLQLVSLDAMLFDLVDQINFTLAQLTVAFDFTVLVVHGYSASWYT